MYTHYLKQIVSNMSTETYLFEYVQQAVDCVEYVNCVDEDNIDITYDTFDCRKCNCVEGVN